MELVIQYPPAAEQTEFNLRRWAEIHADPQWQNYEGRIETDRHGNILMSPPASFRHGRFGVVIAWKLERLMKGGIGVTESPIATADGVRVADVVWISRELLDEAESALCLTTAPEICVEVLSPRNRLYEMKEKKALYFAAGAKEVWFCSRDGRMTFHRDLDDPGSARSLLCPEFPEVVDPLAALPDCF